MSAFSEIDTHRAVANFRDAVAASSFGNDQFAAYGTFLKSLMRPSQIPGIAELRRYDEWSRLMLPSSGRSEAIALIFPNNPTPDAADLNRLLAAIRGRLNGIDGVALTGMSAVAADTQAAAQRDLPRVIGWAGGLIALYLAFHFRSLGGGMAAVVPSMISLLLLLAVMRLFGIETNLVNLAMVPLLLGMNVDYGIFAADVLRHRYTTAQLKYRFVAGNRRVAGLLRDGDARFCVARHDNPCRRCGRWAYS